MTQIPVELPKFIPGKLLEEICIKAAEELGFKTESTDVNESIYTTLTGKQEYARTFVEVYEYLHRFFVFGIKIGKAKNLLFRVDNIKKNTSQEKYTILAGDDLGSATEETIKRYIETVRKYV